MKYLWLTTYPVVWYYDYEIFINRMIKLVGKRLSCYLFVHKCFHALYNNKHMIKMKRYTIWIDNIIHFNWNCSHALEPFIDKSKLHSHHDKYLQTYVNNLNKMLKPYPQLHNKTLEELLCSLEEIPAETCTSVQNNGGGVYNYQLYFASMKNQFCRKWSLNWNSYRNFGMLWILRCVSNKTERSRTGIIRFGICLACMW